MLSLIDLPLVRPWVRILDIPRELLYTGILVFGTLDVYGLSNSVVEKLIVFAIGVLGFFMRKFDFPVASGGSFSPFFTRPSTLVIPILAAAAFLIPLGLKALRNRDAEIRGE